MAISEYAPGRIIVINKDVYKSGGIYSFHSKFKPGEQEHPARPYFSSTDYYRTLYICEEQSCNWMGLSPVKKCPFCGNDNIQQKFILKPWGFAPVNGRKQSEMMMTMIFHMLKTQAILLHLQKRNDRCKII